MTLVSSGEVERALAQRLCAVAGVLLDEGGDSTLPPAGGDLLLPMIEAVQSRLSLDRVWLLCTAVFGVFPSSPAEVLSCARFLELASPAEAFFGLLDRALGDPGAAGTGTLHLVSDAVVVDVDFAAKYDVHTGIQQVVRRTLPRWLRDNPLLPVAWADRVGGWRQLSAAERRRALGEAPDVAGTDVTATEVAGPGRPAPPLVVPWQTVVVLLEAPPSEACERVAALAQFSGNAVVAVGYDCIPAVSADLVSPAEAARFARYLSALKHCRRVAAISRSAAAEFSGFASMLPLQGLRPPVVVECSLPTEPLARVGSVARSESRQAGAPVVLCVGSLEPRKNHLALLYAAERLWQEGLSFEVVLFAGSAWGDDIQRRITQLQGRGRALTVHRDARNEDVAQAYRGARFTVLVSLHEGYGLPVVESLGAGTPVIASNFGSVLEVAAGGGVVTVDPRDDDALVDAMRRLLVDDESWGRLRAEACRRPVRTWDDYARQLWSSLVVPCLPPDPVRATVAAPAGAAP